MEEMLNNRGRMTQNIPTRTKIKKEIGAPRSRFLVWNHILTQQEEIWRRNVYSTYFLSSMKTGSKLAETETLTG